jgi:thiopeptide-type bacteriocin biosynthesis protein
VAAAARALGPIPPPARAPAAAPTVDGWRTFKLFGTSARHSELLQTAVLPAVRAARAAGEIDGWFFLPYVDGPGRRPHLRLRVHAPRGATGFEARLATAVAPAEARGALAAVEATAYVPERGRFRADELDAVHAIFESDSELAAELLERSQRDEDFAGIAAGAQAADALARGLGFDLEARLALARDRRRAAEAGEAIDDEGRAAADAAFRSAGRPLRGALAEEPTGPFAQHLARVSAAARRLPAGSAARLAPTLLHLGAVRLLGPDPDGERLAYTFWQRTLEGLTRSGSR